MIFQTGANKDIDWFDWLVVIGSYWLELRYTGFGRWAGLRYLLYGSPLRGRGTGAGAAPRAQSGMDTQGEGHPSQHSVQVGLTAVRNLHPVHLHLSNMEEQSETFTLSISIWATCKSCQKPSPCPSPSEQHGRAVRTWHLNTGVRQYYSILEYQISLITQNGDTWISDMNDH